MNDRPLTILIVDDDLVDAELLQRNLEKIPDSEFEFIHCMTGEQGREALASQEVDCIFLDYRLSVETGLEVLKEIRQSGNKVPVIMVTGQGDEAIAVEAMKMGAQDYLCKGNLTPDTIHLATTNALEKTMLERKLAEKQQELENFVSIASHDLKSPLRSIHMFTQILKRECQEKIGKKEREQAA